MKKLLYLYLLCFCTLVSSAQTKVACVGNSITYGLKLENREKDAYPFQLQEMLGADFVVGNFGKSGATLLRKGHKPYVCQQEYQDALDFAADIVVIHLGINDTDPRYDTVLLKAYHTKSSGNTVYNLYIIKDAR